MKTQNPLQPNLLVGDNYLQDPTKTSTVHFSANNGRVTVTYKRTRDPDEDCDSEDMRDDLAQVEWDTYIMQGWRPATGYHEDMRRRGWQD